MNHYPYHIGDFDRTTRYLKRIERSIYRDLLDVYYATEKPLTLDLPILKRKILANSKNESKAVELVLKEYFTETPNGWYHSRCESEILRYKANNSQKAMAGKASAAANELRKQQALNDKSMHVEQTFNGTSTNQNQNQNQNHKPITKDPTSQIHSVAKATGGDPPFSIDQILKKKTEKVSTSEIIFNYGVPLLVNAGTEEKHARSFLGLLRRSHGEEALINALHGCGKAKPLQPLEWLAAALPPQSSVPRLNAQEALEASNAAAVKRFLMKDKQVSV